MNKNYKRLKMACYMSGFCMSVVGNLSPILFLTFRSLYGISYSLLGLLVLVNFVTQLTIDLIFSFFSHKFNISKTVKFMPILTISGFLIYSLWSFFSPQSTYIGLLIGTILFSLAGGLGEVLISPVIAAIPSEDPDREMSKLHSAYAWGVVFIVIISTLFLFIAGPENWQWLAILFTIMPITAFLLFYGSEIPEMKTPEKVLGAVSLLKNKGLWLYLFAIFLGGAAELSMAQWSSSYLEQALHIPKIWGDIFGVALFGLMMGIGRSLYAKIGKNIERVLLLGAVGATLCYLITTISSYPLLGLLACSLTGFFVSMLWPGTLVVASERFPSGGVFVYAMMAAGGDLGASVAPQLMGIITDVAANNSSLIAFANSLGMMPEQFGMKLGMFVGMLFPLVSIALFYSILKNKNKNKN